MHYYYSVSSPNVVITELFYYGLLLPNVAHSHAKRRSARDICSLVIIYIHTQYCVRESPAVIDSRIAPSRQLQIDKDCFDQYLKILFRIVDSVTKIASSVLIVLDPCPVGITFNHRSNKSDTFSTPLFVNSSSWLKLKCRLE